MERIEKTVSWSHRWLYKGAGSTCVCPQEQAAWRGRSKQGEEPGGAGAPAFPILLPTSQLAESAILLAPLPPPDRVFLCFCNSTLCLSPLPQSCLLLFPGSLYPNPAQGRTARVQLPPLCVVGGATEEPPIYSAWDRPDHFLGKKSQ